MNSKSKFKIQNQNGSEKSPDLGHRGASSARRPRLAKLPGDSVALDEHARQHSLHGMASVQGAWRVGRISRDKPGLASLFVQSAALFVAIFC